MIMETETYRRKVQGTRTVKGVCSLSNSQCVIPMFMFSDVWSSPAARAGSSGRLAPG